MFKDNDTGEITEQFMKYSSRVEYLKENDHLTGYMGAPPALISMSGDVLSKTDDGWTDVLKKIKSGSGKENSIHTKN
tara:strand:+ start:1689 stop:1919 length:231 start_codon:yes stop_codon:yes gene_type:complete